MGGLARILPASLSESYPQSSRATVICFPQRHAVALRDTQRQHCVSVRYVGVLSVLYEPRENVAVAREQG